MRNFHKALIISRTEMTKKDLIETILLIINRILDYTSSLEQKTPSIFDQNNLEEEKENGKDSDTMSTSQSSNDENNNDIPEIKEKEKIIENKFTLTDYFYFWIEKFDFNENLLLLTMMNIDKLLANQFIISSDNIKNILFTCMVITQKYYEDEIFYDKDYAKIGGYDPQDLVSLEIEFLSLIDFSLEIKEEEFNKYQDRMKILWKDTLSYLDYS